jgi:hypothetical protein
MRTSQARHDDVTSDDPQRLLKGGSPEDAGMRRSMATASASIPLGCLWHAPFLLFVTLAARRLISGAAAFTSFGRRCRRPILFALSLLGLLCSFRWGRRF